MAFILLSHIHKFFYEIQELVYTYKINYSSAATYHRTLSVVPYQRHWPFIFGTISETPAFYIVVIYADYLICTICVFMKLMKTKKISKNH